MNRLWGNGIRRFFKIRVIVLCNVVLLLINIENQAFSQSSELENRTAVSLIGAGFENVSAFLQDSILMIGYENRRFRFEAKGLAEIVKLLSKGDFNQVKMINIVVFEQQIPMIMANYSPVKMNDFIHNNPGADDFEQFFDVTLYRDDVDLSHFTPVNNKSLFKTDLVIIPNWKAQFGDFDNPVQSNINLIPELNTTLRKGLSFKGQVIVPVQNNFYPINDPDGRTIRPGNITLNQLIRLKDDFFVSFTGGFFNLNRAGIGLDMKKYLLNGNLVFGAEAGYTDYYSFTGLDPEYFEDSRFLTPFFFAALTYQPYDATGILRVGNFLYNHPGVRVDVLRQFREVKIGFFALVSSGDINGGFNFSIPIPPTRYCRQKAIRIRPSENFEWEYRARGFPESGKINTTEHSIFEMMLELNPDFVKKQVYIELHK